MQVRIIKADSEFKGLTGQIIRRVDDLREVECRQASGRMLTWMFAANELETVWERGDKVECNGNRGARVIGPYSEGMYEVRLWAGFRHVGDVCVPGSDLKPIAATSVA